MMQWAMGEQLLYMLKALVVDKSMTTLINMETSTTILPVFSNGKTVPKDIIFSAAKWYSCSYEVELFGTKELALPKIDILSLQAIIHGVTAENNDMYQSEHDELFASIRAGKPFNDGEKAAHSSMVAILGRMVAYTGKK